jgi:hypothetical protein
MAQSGKKLAEYKIWHRLNMEALQRTANRGSIATGYNIDNSIVMEENDSAYNFNYDQMTPSEGWSDDSTHGTHRQKLTISFWFKRSNFSLGSTGQGGSQNWLYCAGGGGYYTACHLINERLNFYDDRTSLSLRTKRMFRDTAAWYHVVIAVDQTQSTAANRCKIYVNGVQDTDLEAGNGGSVDYGNQNTNLAVFTQDDSTLAIGSATNAADQGFNGYLAEYHMIDGAQKAASDFGEFDEDSGIWIPKAYDGSHGILGFYYNFKDLSSSTIHDESGNGNDMNNRGDGFEGKQTLDTPTNNFSTLDNNIRVGNQYGRYVTQNIYGSTRTDEPTGSFGALFGTQSFNTGKWYWEIKQYYPTSDVNLQDFGISSIKNTGEAEDAASGGHPSEYTLANYPSAMYGIYPQGGGTTSYGGSSGSAANDNLGAGANGRIFQIAVDADAGKIWFGRDDTWQDTIGGTQPSKSDIAAGNNARYDNLNTYKEGAWIPIFGNYNNNAGHYMDVNFGGFTTATPSSGNSDQNGYGNFEYEPPAGFLALCSKNLGDETVIDDPSAHFQTKTYTGNGGTQSITFDGNSNIHPDALLLKSTGDGHSWWLVNSTSGPTKGVYPDNPNYGPLTSDSGRDVTDFTSDGFALGSPQHANSTNSSSEKVCYAWHMNSGTNNVTDSSQNITSTIQVNSVAKQAIGTYSGSSADSDVVGHGLGVKPHMIWVRATTRVENIRVYDYGSETANGGMSITNTNAQVNNSSALMTAKPTASAMSFGTDLSVGGNGHTYIFYAWGEVAGYSYFGKYHGNGYHNTAGTYPEGKDGPFVHTGFQPAFVMIKRSDTSGSWTIYDDARHKDNSAANSAIFLNAGTAASTGNISGDDIEIYSNGFKVRSNDNTVNQSGGFYSVMAFAKHPQQTSAGIPCTAR